MTGYDVVVIGAGTAGCVMAARLSQDPARRVLLLEAGPDYPTLAELPEEIRNGWDSAGDSHDWDYHGEPRRGAGGEHLPRGRLVGGSGAVNACFALRGSPADYDGWASAGNPGWSFADVLPIFRALEADADFGDRPWHGADGPVPIWRTPPQQLTDLSRAFLDSAEAVGHQRVADHNQPGALGAGPAPLNVEQGVRQSTALTHLAAARTRPNLTIRPDALVDRVQVQRGRATGVRLAHPAESVTADLVILCAGAYGSPAILLRSGIGPADELSACGVEPLLDLSGVGRHLHDHPLVVLALTGPRGLAELPRYQALVTTADLHLFCGGAWRHDEQSHFIVAGGLVRPQSRGRLWLRSADPADPPRIDLGLLTDPADRPPLRAGIRQLADMLATAPLAGLLTRPADDGPPVADDSELDAWIAARAGTYHHPVGSCRMGPDPAHDAVVDASGTVHGIRGLSIVDASIMPTVPAANTNLPTVMVAEHIAAGLR